MFVSSLVSVNDVAGTLTPACCTKRAMARQTSTLSIFSTSCAADAAFFSVPRLRPLPNDSTLKRLLVGWDLLMVSQQRRIRLVTLAKWRFSFPYNNTIRSNDIQLTSESWNVRDGFVSHQTENGSPIRLRGCHDNIQISRNGNRFYSRTMSIISNWFLYRNISIITRVALKLFPNVSISTMNNFQDCWSFIEYAVCFDTHHRDIIAQTLAYVIQIRFLTRIFNQPKWDCWIVRANN